MPYLRDGKLIIENITQQAATDTEITVVGTGSQPPFARMQVTAVFSIQADNPAIVVTATADSNWTLAQEYPSLQHTLVESIHYNSPTLIREHLTFVTPKLSFMSSYFESLTRSKF